MEYLEGRETREAQYKAQSIFDYAPSSNGADDYRELVKEFLGRIKKINK